MNDYICPYNQCNKIFNRPSRLNTHIRVHTGERPYVCDVNGCSKTYTRAAHLKRHKDVFNHDIPSQGCEKFEQRDSLSESDDNTRRERSPRKRRKNWFKCNEPGCDAVFNKFRKLTAHRTSHPTYTFSFICSKVDCGKGFPTSSKLRKHMKVHEGYPCRAEGCGEILDTWTLYRRHFSAVHKVKGVKCTVCHKSFARPSALEKHAKTHADTRDLLHCSRPDCDRKYVCAWSLRQHIRTHHEGQRFHCDRTGCAKSFSAKCSLEAHCMKHNSSPVDKATMRRVTKGRKIAMAADMSGYIMKPLRTSTSFDTAETCEMELLSKENGDETSDVPSYDSSRSPKLTANCSHPGLLLRRPMNRAAADVVVEELMVSLLSRVCTSVASLDDVTTGLNVVNAS